VPITVNREVSDVVTSAACCKLVAKIAIVATKVAEMVTTASATR
jgi:hypothetical protein